MSDARSRRPEISPVQIERDVESAVLAIAIERHPRELTESQVVEEMLSVASTPGRAVAVRRAVDELVRVGLLRRKGKLVGPTAASVRVGELELGL